MQPTTSTAGRHADSPAATRHVAVVIGSETAPAPSTQSYLEYADFSVIAVADGAAPADLHDDRLTWLSREAQRGLGFELERACPGGHSVRKNLGYLCAMADQADIIFDTEAGVLPRGRMQLLPFSCPRQVRTDARFVNAYRFYTKRPATWPRGFPLRLIAEEVLLDSESREARIGVWSALFNQSPDFDALHELVFDKPLTFDPRAPIAMPAGCYCPFNGCASTWSHATHPLMYLPHSVPSAVGDVYRSYVAQVLMRNRGMALGFHVSSLERKPTAGDSMKEFAEQIPLYLRVEELVDCLESQSFDGDLYGDLTRAYDVLIGAGFVQESERGMVRAWCADVCRVWTAEPGGDELNAV